jgi:polyisoprenoid-binding protein YceI
VRYDIDPARSQVSIEARSSLHPIHSETTGLEGFFEGEFIGGGRLNLRVPPEGRLELPVQRLSSGNPLYDREMKRRIDARRFPTISGELREMRDTGHPGRYSVDGEVTFRGVSRPVSDELTLSVPEDGTIVFDGEHVFDIREFGMEPPKILMLKVHPDVTVRVHLVARAR